MYVQQKYVYLYCRYRLINEKFFATFPYDQTTIMMSSCYTRAIIALSI